MSVGIGGGYGSSSSKSKQLNYPKWSEEFLKQFPDKGTQTLSQYDPTGGALRQSAGDELSRTVSGYYTDPNNPVYAARDQAVTDRGMDNLSRALALGRTGSQNAGALNSVKAQVSQDETARRGAQDINDTIATLRAADLARERGMQVAATQPATNFSLLDLNQSLAIANMLKGLAGKGSQSQSGWNVAGQASASYGGGMGM